jgi:hypothetical protein
MRAALVLGLCLSLTSAGWAKGPKVHTAAVGKPRLVTWASTQDPSIHLTLQVRPLIVDGRRKEWVTGETHDVTDHSFVALQVQHLNDSMPGDKTPHFIWQAGVWLMVERNTGHVTQLHLTGYDPALSGLSWFRDYAAYCSLTAQAKSLYAEVVELNQRKPVARKKIGAWPLPAMAAGEAGTEAATEPVAEPVPPNIHHGPARRVPSVMQRMNTGAPHPVACNTIEWMRDPLRAILTPRSDLPPVMLDLSAVPEAPVAAD